MRNPGKQADILTIHHRAGFNSDVVQFSGREKRKGQLKIPRILGLIRQLEVEARPRIECCLR
jgi:hypothetical protein